MTVFVLLLNIALIEVVCVLFFYIRHGYWHFRDPHHKESITFEQHPYLVAVPETNREFTHGDITITHNQRGFRSSGEQSWCSHGDIITIGGSTTYGIRLNDNETWPYILNHFSGTNTTVVNYGVPGYSSVEHIIQTALNLSDLQPVVVIYYMGWNDVRNLGIKNLKADYSDFHGKSQFESMKLSNVWCGPNVAFMRVVVEIMQAVGWLRKSPAQQIDIVQLDPEDTLARAIEMYKRNVALLISLCHSQHITPVFIPQVLNEHELLNSTGFGCDGWVPFIKNRELPAFMDAYNYAMMQVVSNHDANLVSEVLDTDWSRDDFLDMGHFSAAGNERFAKIVCEYLRTNNLLFNLSSHH